MKKFSYKLHGKFFQAFSNPSRFEILQLLREKPRSVLEICSLLFLEQSSVSHNLSCLLNCGFVNVKRKGKQRIYSIDKKTILPIMKEIDNHIFSYSKRLEKCNTINSKEKIKTIELTGR